MTPRDRISPRQFVAAVFLSAVSLLVRRFPHALVARAGRGAMVAVPLSILPILAVVAAAVLLFRNHPAGSGLSDVFTGILGPAAGRILTGIYGLWFICYAGFLLRSGAERFLTTVYTGAHPWVFLIIMTLLCAPAAAGRVLPLARSSMLVRPLMLTLILGIALLTLKDIDPALLMPLRTTDLRADVDAALEIANLLSILVFFGFLGDRLERPLRVRDYAPWLAALLAVIGLMTAGCLGMFGAELTAKMRYPYFMLVRDLTVLGALERIEPVVIAMWVFSDFILISLLLQLAAANLRTCLGFRPERAHRRILPLLCTAAAAAAAFSLPGSLDAQRALSERIVPLFCAIFGFGPILPLLAVGALRKKL